MFNTRMDGVFRGRLILALLAGVFLAGCGGGGGGGGPAVTISITPPSSNVSVQSTQAFNATITNSTNHAVTWKVQEGASGGSITAAGVYTAPAISGTYHVVATSQADSSKSKTAAVTVHTTVVVTPDPVTVLAGQTQSFTAAVLGSSNTAVTWSVVEGATGGTISAAGLYTAPSTPGVYHITATTQTDSTLSPPATVTVQGGNVQGTIQ